MSTLFSFLALLLVLISPPVFAHGTEYEILSDGVTGIRAAFESGEAMADARVLVFAPGETKVTCEKKTDRNGIVCFAPDRAGLWILQVRDSSGHGMRVNLEVNEDMLLAEQTDSGGYRLTSPQKTIMALCVVWGFVGTALFFRKNRLLRKERRG
jgi:nickel transport protein